MGVVQMAYAAMKTEPEQVLNRAILGMAGLLMLIFGVYRI
jgi:hypothetical protein